MIATAVMDRGVSTQAPDEIPRLEERFESTPDASARPNSPTGEDLQYLSDPFDEAAWPRDGQLFPRARPPPRGDCLHAGCIARLDVVHGIADEQRLVGLVTEALQRGQYGLGMGFVSRAGVTAHDRLEIAGDPDELETASREHVALARDHRHWMACLLEGGQRRRHLLVATHEVVMVRELMLSIGGDQPIDLDVLGCVALEHGPERNADAREPLLVGGDHPLAFGERMPHRSQNERDRVDERAIEIEEDRCRPGGATPFGGVDNHHQSYAVGMS